MLNRRQVVGGLVSPLSRFRLAVMPPSGGSRDEARWSVEQSRVCRSPRGDVHGLRRSDVISIQLSDRRRPPLAATGSSLVFRGPDPALLEGPYTVSHRPAGSTTLFLQLSGSDNRYSYYERRSTSCCRAPAFDYPVLTIDHAATAGMA
jgi:hypothetical protein